MTIIRPRALSAPTARSKFGSRWVSHHTFTPAGSHGTIGPDLDQLKHEAARANRGPLDAFIEESIVKPDAYVEPNFQDLMPHSFGTQIPPDQLKQLVQYLSGSAQ
jgi:hypothetical protein